MDRVLIIEDDVQVADMLSRALEPVGYDVKTALDGAEGLKFNRQNPADLIITDILLPGTGGIETIAELRRDYPEVKIIAISGGGRVSAEEHLKVASQMGANLTLAKPFTYTDLMNAVRTLL